MSGCAGRLGARGWVGRTVAVLATAVLLPAVMAACDSGGSSPAARSGPVTRVGHTGRISVRLTLDHGAAPSGGTVRGIVTIDNRSGVPRQLVKCGDPFQVWLGRRGAWPEVAFPACAQRFTVPVGRTGYPVALRAVWPSCRSGDEPAFVPSCDQQPPPDSPPPVAPGHYQARFFDATGLGVRPPDLPFTVLRVGG